MTKWKAASVWTVRVMLCIALPSLAAAQIQRPEQGPKPVITGERAMVSASHPEVSRTMLEVLKKGGNAVDALITGLVFQTVLEPQMSTIAGGMSALIYEAKTGKVYYLDAELDHTSDNPPISRPVGPGMPETSGLRIGVPGTVAGLHAAAERFGSVPWEEYFKPAIQIAEDGFPMYSFLYAEMVDAALHRLTAFPSGRELYTPNGFVPAVGEIFRRPAMAKTLRRLGAEGPEYFYRGEWARDFVDEVNRTGGRMLMEDMAGYEARWEEPLPFTYRGTDLVGSPPPATGGTLIALVLNILENFDLKSMGHYTQSSKTLALFHRAFALAESDTERFAGDPISFDTPTDVLVSKEYAKTLARLLEKSWPKVDLKKSTAAGPQGVGRAEGDPHYTDTNHLVIVDEQGNWVSSTHTVYGSTFGTGLVVDGIGVNSGNAFPGVGVGKGRRVLAPFPPTFAMRDGKPWLALGSPGLSSRAVAITLANLLGFGMDLYEALDAPRFDGFLPGQTFRVETRVPDEVRKGLESFGIGAEPTAPYNWHFGSIQAVMQATGKLVGVSDPRRAGYAAGY